MEHAMKLAEVPAGESVVIRELDCSARDLSRLAPLGIVCGTCVQMVRNSRRGAVLVEARNTVIALSRVVAEGMTVRGRHDGKC